MHGSAAFSKCKMWMWLWINVMKRLILRISSACDIWVFLKYVERIRRQDKLHATIFMICSLQRSAWPPSEFLVNVETIRYLTIKTRFHKKISKIAQRFHSLFPPSTCWIIARAFSRYTLLQKEISCISLPKCIYALGSFNFAAALCTECTVQLFCFVVLLICVVLCILNLARAVHIFLLCGMVTRGIHCPRCCYHIALFSVLLLFYYFYCTLHTDIA